MKILLLSLLLSLTTFYSYSQNTFPGSGNVGIGTNSPKALLDVGKPLAEGEMGSVLARLIEGNTEGGGTYLGVRGYRTQTSTANPSVYNVKSFAIEHSFYGKTNSSINFLRGGDELGGSISFNTSENTEKMRILGNGNVGIGTIKPLSLLHVNGNILAKEVRVEAGPWPDYVFKPDYQLRSLKEVETFINKNFHLPEMPTEKEVKENGIELGEMNRLLLKKVEELTLYLIERVKNEDKLRNEVDLLKAQVSEMKNKIKL